LIIRSGASILAAVKRAQNLLGWPGLTFWLQVAVLATAARSVDVARWVEAPSLTVFVFLATLMAAFLVHRRKQHKLNHLWAVLAGASLAYLVGVYLAEADQWLYRFSELHTRMALWWTAVVGEDMTTDTLPLSMALIAITWLTAYSTSWALFRYRAVWAVLLPIGAGVIVNLTYLPERYFFYFFIFLFLGLLLLVHVTALKRRSQLESQHIPYPSSINRLSMANGLWLSAVALGITVLLPLGGSPASPLKGVFGPVDSSIEDLRNTLHRIFAAVPGHGVSYSRFYYPILPLLRPVPGGEDTFFSVQSSFPMYWPAVAYDQYTSKAWKIEDTDTIPMWSADDDDPYFEEGEGVEAAPGSVSYTVKLNASSSYLMIAGTPMLVEPDSRQETPATTTFQVDLVSLDRNSDLPPDLQKLASTLSSVESTGQVGPEQIPYNLMVTKVVKELSTSGAKSTVITDPTSLSYYSDLVGALRGEGDMIGMDVTRMPLGTSQVTYRPLKPLGPGDEYSVIADMSIPSEATLRNAPQSYPPGISDRYLQIPDTVPSRVLGLARSLSQGASNPYDSAQAIETYLRDMEYSTATPTLPYDADAVDQFLFESKVGYSDYFASAMAVMLREVGVPTRLVFGFGPGVEGPEGQGYVVREKDSHSWPEAYFTNVGWVPFEPTPIYELRPRSQSWNPFDVPISTGGGSAIEEIDPESGLLQSGQETEKRDDFGGPLPGGFGPRSPLFRYFGTPLGTGGALFVLFLLVGGILLRVLWSRQYGGLRYPDTAFERMHRLATFLGIPSSPSQTPFEFAHSLSQVVPEAREDIDLVCDSFVGQRYGGGKLSTIEGIRITLAWNRAKGKLLAQPLATNRRSHPSARDVTI
jgi:transglutaminase-like putative cysteine protease